MLPGKPSRHNLVPYQCANPIYPNDHSLPRSHLDFLQNFGDFPSDLLHTLVHEYLWDGGAGRAGAGGEISTPTHLILSKKSLSSFAEYSPFFPQR